MNNPAEIAMLSLGQCIEGIRELYRKQPEDMRNVKLCAEGIEQPLSADELLAIAVMRLKNMISVMEIDRKHGEQLRRVK